MTHFDDRSIARAGEQRFLLTRHDAIEAGGSDGAIKRRLATGRWLSVHPGVYQVDHRPSDWSDRLIGAVLAAGGRACASHRAALILWGLDGIGSAPIELTVPHHHGPVPVGAIVHRTRRPVDAATVDHVPVTTVERTLLDSCSLLSPITMSKALESALRKRLTTVDLLRAFIQQVGGRGVKGTRLLRRLLDERTGDTATGSGSETEALFHMREGGVPDPMLQHRFVAKDGAPIVPDFYWPYLEKAVEIDGLDAHDSADKLDHDLLRQNKLLDLGIELRRYSARHVRRHPEEFVRSVQAFLASR